MGVFLRATHFVLGCKRVTSDVRANATHVSGGPIHRDRLCGIPRFRTRYRVLIGAGLH